jgi:phosphatidylglycerol---prolipoprotein diacylglyceryl transferase
MAILNYIIWNGSPEIFTIGTFALRWYGLLFAVGFLISQQILYYIYRKEGKPERDVETLTIYMVIATIIGARLGHVIFYDPQIIWEEPLSIFLPFEFSPFRFTGLQGLASHGAAIGILFALWLYANYDITFSKTVGEQKAKKGEEGKPKKKRGMFFRKRKLPGQSYLQVLDRIVILVALTGALIRFGNFFNSEIIGKPADSPLAVVFANPLTENMTDNPRINPNDIVEEVTYRQNDTLPKGSNGRVPIAVYVMFKEGVSDDEARSFIRYSVKELLTNSVYEHFDEGTGPIDYHMITHDDGKVTARINTLGIARHPAQLYESISSFILFIVLFLIWYRYKQNLPPGLIFGIFLVVLWSLRFTYEFLKEPQESFENDLPLFMGQILSIPLVLVGIGVLIYAFKNKNKVT